MRRFVRTHPLIVFFPLAWLSSWTVMVPLALSRHGVLPPLPGWIHYLSAYGPMLAAAICLVVAGEPKGLRAWLDRLTRWRAGPGWWALALSPLLLYGLAAVAQRWVQGAWPDPRLLGRVLFLPDLGLWAPLLWLLNSGLGEESGWRGYALPTLARRMSPRRASVVIACGWMIWHVPAFFYLPAYEQMGLGIMIGFFVGILSGSFLLTWLAIGSGGSALLPIVWHAGFNLTTAPPSSRGLVDAVSSTAVTLIGLVALWRLRAHPSSSREDP